MGRKTVIWIVIGVLAAAVFAVVGIVSYHAGFDHGAGAGVINPGGPLRGFGFGFGRRFGGVAFFPGLRLLGLLAAGALGALIIYLVTRGRRQEALQTTGQVPASGGGGPADPQWQQFEQWYRQMHGTAAPETPTAPMEPVTQAPPVPAATPSAPAPPEAPK